MTYFESLNFVYQLALARFDPPVWVWSVGALLFTILALHLGWGRLWNRHWRLFTSPAMGTASVMLALLVFAATLVYVAADRSEQWLDQQRQMLPTRLADSGSLMRRIFKEASRRLGKPAAASQNQMDLLDTNELMEFTETAAAYDFCPLRPTGPLGPGAPCALRDPVSVAQDIVARSPAATFPLTVTPDNPWFQMAVKVQVQAALDHITPLLRQGMHELKSTALFVVGGAILIVVIFVPITAVANIKVHPKA